MIPRKVLKQLVDDPRIFDKQRSKPENHLLHKKNLTTKCPTPQNTAAMIKSCEKRPFQTQKLMNKNFMDSQNWIFFLFFGMLEERRYTFEERKLQPLNCQNITFTFFSFSSFLKTTNALLMLLIG